jgi:hypothetical protein
MAKAPSLKDKLAKLEKHAGSRDTILFTEEVKHGRLRFHKGMVVKFPSPALAAYFDVAFNGTELTDKKPTWELAEDELQLKTEEGQEHDMETPDVVDLDTVIGLGREGVTPGTTVFGHLNGDGPISSAELQPADADAEARS